MILISERNGKPMYRAPGTHFWVIRKLYDREGDPYAELERRGEHPNGTAYLQVRISRLLKLQLKADAIALYDDGKGLDANQIAKKLKCSRRTVNRYLKMTLTNSIE